MFLRPELKYNLKFQRNILSSRTQELFLEIFFEGVAERSSFLEVFSEDMTEDISVPLRIFVIKACTVNNFEDVAEDVAEDVTEDVAEDTISLLLKTSLRRHFSF